MNPVICFSGRLVGLLFLLGLTACQPGVEQGGSSREASSSKGKEKSLQVFCAAGLKKPVAELADAFSREFRVEVQLQYGGTGTLLSQIRVAGRGDLFLGADAGAMAEAERLELVRERIPVVTQFPVIAVSQGNPKQVRSLADLFRKDLRVAVANPEAASIGRITQRAMGERWEELAEKVQVMKPTVTELAADLRLGAVDAAVVWNSTVPQFEGLEGVEVKEFLEVPEEASIGVLEACVQPGLALQFARYLAAPAKGGEVFRKWGFRHVAGDTWEERPELILYSGGVNRPAVEKLLNQFADREEIRMTTVFNGCGILCAAMKAMKDTTNPKFPDAYYACDLCFVPPVAEEFPESVLLTETEIGIIVPKANPHDIRTLADLAKPGLKVGLCNAQQSTLGYMTQGMLASSGLDQSIRKNLAVEVPTADFLVNQMLTGALDAAIVYKVNYMLREKDLTFIQVQHEGARAVQPFAVRGDSERRQLAGRLLQHLLKHREAFEETGFQWRGDEGPMPSRDIEIPDWLKMPDGKR